MSNQDQDIRNIEAGMALYADSIDSRDWTALDGVFDEEIETGASSAAVRGRNAFVAMIRRYLDSCGPTQHLLGQTRIESLADDRATSVTAFRAFHCDRPEAIRTFEVLGRYRVTWRRTAAGWRATQWRYEMIAQIGDPGVLGAPVRAPKQAPGSPGG
ncbi:nuclear transport factor 2 family protein [uncultured Sphingomonas sp.]|uniref:nuclear transport factor 2 family protein n=1 Tax=uncultured Sphingomonas sp. TaxID=158754 RepID=UPI002629877E|nr:nuclear transport factor 2 family protein [uncultured Sphingomonas sp.]